LCLIGSSFAAQKQQTIIGELMDSSCAKMGSHEMMEKQHNMPSNAASDEARAHACVEGGAKLVFYDTQYELDDQKKPEQIGNSYKFADPVIASPSLVLRIRTPEQRVRKTNALLNIGRSDHQNRGRPRNAGSDPPSSIFW
jgi:hypothetical protein